MSMLTPSWGGGKATPKKPFNPLANIVPAKSTAPKKVVQTADDRRTANPTLGVAAPKAYSGPLIDPTSGASGVAAYAAQQAAGQPDTGNPPSVFDAAPTPIEVAAPDVTEETLKKTAEYMARERALASALDFFNSDQALQGTRFGETYNKNLGDLGWRSDVNDWDYGQLLSSGQKATESGRAFQSLSNDFAARGMLQSGAYQGARSILQNQLNDKRGAVEKSKADFGVDQEAKRKAFLTEQETARTQALADARAAILGGMGA